MISEEILQRMLAPLVRGVRLLFGRGVLTGTNDELKLQNAQMTSLDGETFDDVERPQQYGQISVPLPGAETFFGCLLGDRDQAVILVVEDRRYRPVGLPAGDSGIYHYEGHRLRLTKDGRAILTCKTLEVYADDSILFDSPESTFTGNLTVQQNTHIQGNLALDGTGDAKGHFTMSDATIAGVTYSGHTHHENGRGSNTGGPQNG
ncbi:TPA: phage baseplate assembly protein V [Salmonella enterica subsp. enterica serovar Stanley]|nr:phage baseplate assembly protein V [Salmonella enterica]MDJ3786942.1 phage baseplate assembly protein V [Salmonella enterica]